MFESAVSNIEALFASSAWTDNNIPTYPRNYQGSISSQNEFVRIAVLAPDAQKYAYGNKKVINGALIVSIFTAAGNGQRRAYAIGDLLDTLLVGSVPTASLEFGASFIDDNGIDPANSSLHSAQYTIPFTFYEE